MSGIALLGNPDLGPEQSAHGGGTAVEVERRSTFTFNAVRHGDGVVTGSLVYMFRDFDLDYKAHMKLDCLIIEGNRAKVSGLITKVTANFPLCGDDLDPYIPIDGNIVITP